MSKEPSPRLPRRLRLLAAASVALLGTAAIALIASAQEAGPNPATAQTPLTPPSPQQTQDDLVKRGEYIAIASDCAACHTVPGSKELFAGSYGIESPMGTIYASNITPSKQYGIGNFTEEQFARAVREGISADGTHLYPAMPYPSYAMMTDEDVHALYAYFMQGVKPVEKAAKETKLDFPFGIRSSMALWNALYLDDTRFTPDAGKGEDWNRGKYLVESLAHCGECHTPRNEMMALDTDAAHTGAALGAWHAPNLTSDPVSGLGGWSDEELAAYLKTGHVAGKGEASGPMAEAITNSLQHLHDGDIKAMIAYLRTLPPVRTPGQTQPAFSFGTAASVDGEVRGLRPMVQGAMAADMQGNAIYDAACASCHQTNGLGTDDGFYPSLVHNTNLGGNTPDNLIATILFGVEREVGHHEVSMPSFGAHSDVQALSDEQIATLSNYLFKQFGNPQLSVTPEYVKTLRAGGEKPLIARIAGPGAIAGGVIALLILIALVVWFRRRKKR